MAELKFGFDGGWSPSDAKNEGAQNALLRMKNLELEKNGAIRLNSGTFVLGTYPAAAHTLFSRYIGPYKYRYAALSNGYIYRNLGLLSTGGSLILAAFGLAYNYVIICSGNYRVLDNGFAVTTLYLTAPTVAPTMASTGAGGVISGDYQWKYQLVKNNGSFLNTSNTSPESIVYTITASDNPLISAPNPLLTDPTLTTVRFFRRGEGLILWTLIQELDLAPFGAAPTVFFYDFLSDDDALAAGDASTGNVLNDFLLTLSTTDTPQEIRAIVGPIYTRNIYFTDNEILISEPNSPSTYDYRTVIRYSGNGVERFLWAKAVGENTILIGTTKDLYVLTGLFTTFPDGTIDVYLRHLGTAFPPISYDVAIYNNNAIYMAADGWRIFDTGGGSELLVSPKLSLLYENTECYGLLAAKIELNNGRRYGVGICENKLFMCPLLSDDTHRVEIWDFVRKYWSMDDKTQSSILFTEEDGILLGFDNVNFVLRALNYRGSTLIDSATAPTMEFLTKFQNGGNLFNRKDPASLKFKMNSGGSNVSFQIFVDDDETASAYGGTAATSALQEGFFDISAIGPRKSFALRVYGQMASFELTNLELMYEPRPNPTNYVRIPATNFGTSARKRIPDHNFVIESLNGSVVTASILGDNILIFVSTYTSTFKRTCNANLAIDQVNVDFEYIFRSPGLFEFFGVLDPSKNMEVLPEAITYKRTNRTNLGSAMKKRLGVWPFVIDTRGFLVQVTCLMDGDIATPAQAYSTTLKTTCFFRFGPIDLGVDFELIFSGTGPFELYEVMQPDILETLPILRRYFTTQSFELLRYGKVKEFEVRILSTENQTLNYVIYFDDETSDTNNFDTIRGKESVIRKVVPKTTQGRIMRFEISTANFDFHLFYCRALVSKSGVDSDLAWIMLGENA